MNEEEERTRELVLQLELEEAHVREERVSGKARGGSRITDEQLALQAHLAELQRSFQIMGDSHLARSINSAMGTDADILALYLEVDRMEIADRNMAISLSRPGSVHTPIVTSPVARSNIALRTLDRSLHTLDRSTQRSVPIILRPTTSTLLISEECVICMEVIGRKTHLRVPCGHFYDEKCLVSLIQSASKDESVYPPRCCKQTIPQELFLPLLARDVRTIFEKSAAEFSTRPRNRVYCSNNTCSEFLGDGSQFSRARSMQCPRCARVTCSACCGVAHSNSTTCKKEETNPAIQALVEENKWQRCPECHWVIELTHGCYHITCRCNAQFCYLCTSKWRTCECPQWEERHLFAEAERRVDAELMEEVAAPAPTRTVAPAIVRQTMIADMARTLRENHVCDHSWRLQQGGGECGNCNKYWNRYRLRCSQCYMHVCVPCARNRM